VHAIIVCPPSKSARADLIARFPPQQAKAQSLLTQFQEHPDAWQRVPVIIEQTTNEQNKVGSISASGLPIADSRLSVSGSSNTGEID
jgi:hypothetical protein